MFVVGIKLWQSRCSGFCITYATFLFLSPLSRKPPRASQLSLTLGIPREADHRIMPRPLPITFWVTPVRDNNKKWIHGRKEDLLLLLYDRRPWLVHEGPCSSNARVVLRQICGETSFLEVIPRNHKDRCGRVDLQLRVSGFGRPYLHRLCWWFLLGKRHKDFGGNWAAFECDNRKVDHGTRGMPFKLDWRTLRLQSSSQSARQGPTLAAQYHARGGLGRMQRKRRRVKKRTSN